MKTRPRIKRIIMIGDSLSERGTMFREKLFGFIPMKILSGLKGKTPDDSFTNGFPWSDHFITALANKFTIKKLKTEKGLDDADIADGIINDDAHIRPVIDNYYNLKNDLFVNYDGENFIRNYTIGGLTAHDYSWLPSTSISRFFSRLILPTLQGECKKLLNYDKVHHLSSKFKAETLIIEWSGANDLITVNARPSKKEADGAVKARINNLRKLINNGYSNFILFNLPDLSLTPRYQAKNEKERENARVCSEYFNEELNAACMKLREEYPDCCIQLFDANKEFQDMFHHPEKYNLDKDKRHQPYTTSADFKIKENSTSPADGYMFWDAVHPTADVHAFLAQKILQEYENVFEFIAPDEKKKEKYKNGFFFQRKHMKKANDDFYMDLSSKNKMSI